MSLINNAINTNNNELNNTSDNGWSVSRSRSMIRKLNSEKRMSRENSVVDTNSRSQSPQIPLESIRFITTPSPSESPVNQNFSESEKTTPILTSKLPNQLDNISPPNQPIPSMGLNYSFLPFPPNFELPANITNSKITPNIFNNQVTDIWSLWHNIFNQQKMVASIFLEKINEELKYPPVLRGKPDNIRKNEICQKLYPIVDNILKDMNVELDDLISTGKITGMIREEFTALELIKFFDAPLFTSLRKTVEECFEQLSNSKGKIETIDELSDENESVNSMEKMDIKIEEKVVLKSEETLVHKTEETLVHKTEEKVVTKTFSNNRDKKYTIDQVLEFKKALVEAQEKFFSSCLPTKDEVDEINQNLIDNDNWNGIAKRISVLSDEILVGEFKFSKKHYLSNDFFVKRLIKKYKSYFPSSSWIKLVPPKKDTKEYTINIYKND